MLNTKERKLMDEAETTEELERVRASQTAAKDKAEMPKKPIGISWLFLIGGALIALVGTILILVGLGSGGRMNLYHESTDTSLPGFLVPGGIMIGVGALAFVFAIFGLLTRNRKFGKSIMVAPDGEIPEYPEETIATKAVSPLKKDKDRPMAVRKVYQDDPEKRVIKMDKRKVERVLDHDITFPKLSEALIRNCSRRGIEMSEIEAAKVLCGITLSRTLFVMGVAKEQRLPFLEALAQTMKAGQKMIDASASLKEMYSKAVPALAQNTSFLLGVDEIYPQGVMDFFGDYAKDVADYSCDHSYRDSSPLSMNLIFVLFVPEEALEGVDPDFLSKSAVLQLSLGVEKVPSKEEALVVRSSGDEIRYFALHEKNHYFLPDEQIAAFDALYELAEKKGHRIENDVENAFERAESALMMLGLSPEKVAGIVCATGYVPYLLAVFDKAAIAEEGGLRETIERAFGNQESIAFIRPAMRALTKKGVAQ